MIIRYKNKTVNINLIFGLIWLAFFIVNWIVEGSLKALDYFWLFMAATYLIVYYYLRNHHYLTITKDRIKINGPFGKEFLIKDIVVKKKFAGDYILKTDTKEMGISTQMVHKDSLEQLEQVLDQIPIAWS
ncbi:hypothetical protein KH5_12440 [Urechidicola sp. KH5]